MTDIKEIKLVDVKNNSNIINNLNSIYKLWGYEEVSPSFINTLETIKGRGVIEENQLVGIVSNSSCLLYTSPSPRDISGSRMPSSA